MKRVIKAADDFFDAEFTFDLSDDFIEQSVIPKLREAITDKYGRRFKNIGIDFDDVRFNEARVDIQVDVYNKDVHKGGAEFRFIRYTSYFDESDFYQHLNTTISQFVSNLI